MKRVFAACAMAAALAVAGTAQANEKLAQASGCTTCHAVDKKIIGPSFKDVAAKYGKQKGSETMLFTKVKEGGKGNWGDTPMPPNKHVKDDDIKTLVSWILSQK
jgi:cytochrome c